MMEQKAPFVLLKWEDVLDELLMRTSSFPKHARFQFAQRLEGFGLDVYEHLIEARYNKLPVEQLDMVNLLLEKMRLFLRLCYKRRFLAEGGLRELVMGIDEVGRMVGGWRRSLIAE